jgi:hypothetical protein
MWGGFSRIFCDRHAGATTRQTVALQKETQEEET